MSITTLRQKGRGLVLTIPDEVAERAGWRAGTLMNISTDGDAVKIRPSRRVPRGRKTVAQLLAGIDQDEIRLLNAKITGERQH
ncbi:AbrB/MazE/SpoVT family DNA-binding domain-containing protein [Pantoea stewartii]|uniref:AbrB/MazE/SpoVT family DNA-binding domain-containing protein n=1 Tax=Pantoea stewartii TaxID=66269 RepID=UPI001981D87B|nr:AbrB/MazE/SpoVT family DNA-binding domain-containing protein [Pantoea stewartii]